MGYRLINIGQTAFENPANSQRVSVHKSKLDIVTH